LAHTVWKSHFNHRPNVPHFLEGSFPLKISIFVESWSQGNNFLDGGNALENCVQRHTLLFTVLIYRVTQRFYSPEKFLKFLKFKKKFITSWYDLQIAIRKDALHLKFGTHVQKLHAIQILDMAKKLLCHSECLKITNGFF